MLYQYDFSVKCAFLTQIEYYNLHKFYLIVGNQE